MILYLEKKNKYIINSFVYCLFCMYLELYGIL